MKKISFLILSLIIVFSSNAQNDNSNCYLEFIGDSIKISGLNVPIFGTLLYSKEGKNIFTRENSSSSGGSNFLIVKPLIRILESSKAYPQKLSLSILLYTSEIVNGIEKRTFLNTQLDIKNQLIKQIVNQVGIEEKYTIADDGLFNQYLKLSFENPQAVAIYSDEIRDAVQTKLSMYGIRITIQHGNKIN